MRAEADAAPEGNVCGDSGFRDASAARGGARPALSNAVQLLLAVACGLAVANVYYAQPLLDAIADAFGLRPAAVGVVITITQIGYGMGLLLLVPLGDLVDRRLLIVGQSLLSAVALVCVAIARSTTAFLAAMAVVGLLAVVTQVLVAHAASSAPANERGRVVGIVTSGIVVGILLARTVSGILSDAFGWRSVYLVSAVATSSVSALMFKVLPARGPTRTCVSYPQLIASMFRLFAQEPVLRVRATLALLIFCAITVLLTPLVLPLSAPPRSLSHTQVGLFGLAGVAGALGATRAGLQADSGHAQRTTGIGLAAMLLAWLPVALLPRSLWAAVVGLVAIDFGLQSVHVTNQSLIYRVRPEAQSRLAAGYMMFYSIGCATGSIVSTHVYALAGWSGVCALGAFVSTVSVVFWLATLHLTPEPRS